MDMFAATVRQHQVGAFTFGDDAAIVRPSACAGFLLTRRIACGSVKALSSSSAMRNAASSRLAG
jgi:hypothetical protein